MPGQSAFNPIRATLPVARGCIVSGTSTPLTNGAYTPLIFASADSFDSDNFHDPAVNNTRITIPSGFPASSKWRLTTRPHFPASTSTDRRVAYSKNGGAEDILQRDVWAGGSVALYTSPSRVLILSPGDYIEIELFINQAALTSTDYEASLFLEGT